MIILPACFAVMKNLGVTLVIAIGLLREFYYPENSFERCYKYATPSIRYAINTINTLCYYKYLYATINYHVTNYYVFFVTFCAVQGIRRNLKTLVYFFGQANSPH